MFTKEDVIAVGSDIIDGHGSVDAWRVSEFDSIEIFEDYIDWSLDTAPTERVAVNAAISFGIVLERLRAQQ